MRFVYYTLIVCTFTLLSLGKAYCNSTQPSELEVSTQMAIQFLKDQQSPDGSYTRLSRVSTPIYSSQMICLYEFLGVKDQKKDRIDRLMKAIWEIQTLTGGFSSYADGPDDINSTAMVYLAAKIAGEPNASPRLQKLENAIIRLGGIKASRLDAPYYLLMGLNAKMDWLPAFTESLLMKFDRSLPWTKVMIYPMLYLITTGQTAQIAPENWPRLVDKKFSATELVPHPFRKLFLSNQHFFSWLLSHLSEDGTLFNYTPTSIPALMALSTQGNTYQDLVLKGLATLESFQETTASGGLVQSPGDSAVAETFVVGNTFLDAGLLDSDSNLQGIENFLQSVKQSQTGAFGFSKHNIYYPDSDDTGNVIYLQKRLALRRGETSNEPFLPGLDWLLSIQNKDGGFGTWDKETFLTSMIEKTFLRKSPIVLSKSVIEHSARVAISLSYFKDVPRYRKAYQKVIHYLSSKQNEDGSFNGTWFVDYLFGTSMATAALATADDANLNSAIEKGLNFILSHQQADGGFGESPESFSKGEIVALAKSSPAQTGLVAMGLLNFLAIENNRHLDLLMPALNKAIKFLISTQAADGSWHDATWTGVTFPNVEYLIYPIIQDAAPADALALYEKLLKSKPQN